MKYEDIKECKCPECKVVLHASDCAVHNEPAYPKGECSCGATKTKPLTEEEILDLCMVCAIQPDSDPITLAFARAIERAHGTGEKR